MKFDRVGDIVTASGEGWSYERVGDLTCFTQTKKLPSLRIVKVLLKKLEKTGDI